MPQPTSRWYPFCGAVQHAIPSIPLHHSFSVRYMTHHPTLPVHTAAHPIQIHKFLKVVLGSLPPWAVTLFLHFGSSFFLEPHKNSYWLSHSSQRARPYARPIRQEACPLSGISFANTMCKTANQILLQYVYKWKVFTHFHSRIDLIINLNNIILEFQ